ncbi:MAG: hypothetical protein GY715_14355 [Planctomycetes bacterium]|nr:hypothetical protein [Planctomycetota bacterium]
MPDTKLIICPYCGETQTAEERCRSCRGIFEPLSLQATHNDMGPWYLHEPERPFRPGCSYEMLARMIERGQVTKYTVLRGPTTRQFWTVARHVPGIAHLLGYCHACDAAVESDTHGCPRCGVPFGAYLDRNHLGLPEVRPLPGEAPDGSQDPAFTGNGRYGNGRSLRGISSFASDEELLATMSPRTSYGPAPNQPIEPWRGTAEETAPDAGAVTDADPLTSPLVRSMRRTLARQKRMNRILTVLVVVVALAGAVLSLIGFRAAAGG